MHNSASFFHTYALYVSQVAISSSAFGNRELLLKSNFKWLNIQTPTHTHTHTQTQAYIILQKNLAIKISSNS